MQRKTIIHPYTAAMVSRVEVWLCDMALKGWMLEKKNGWKFTFVQSSPRKREYFMYSPVDLSKGFSFDYYMAEKRYKSNKRKQIIGSHSIFEVDSDKIDEQYSQYKSARTNYYKKHYLKLFFATFLCIAVLSVLSIVTEINLLAVIVILLFPLIYFAVSYILVKCPPYK